MKTILKATMMIFLGLVLVGLPFGILAAENKPDQAIQTKPEEIINGNFIKAANVIEINGPVNGDVIVAGSSITINGSVAGDVMALGNIIRINGPVAGSVRVAGSSVEINNVVGHNLWAFGSTVAMNQAAKVGWDVYSGGGSVEIKGPIEGNVWLGAGTAMISSSITKNLDVALDTEGQLILSPEAQIGGNLTYQAKDEKQLVVKEGAKVAGTTTKKDLAKPVKQDWSGLVSGAYVFWKVISLFSLVVVGLVLVSLVPKFLLEVNTTMLKKPWPAFGWGVVYLLIAPIAVLLLICTLIGLPLALILICLYFISLYLSKVIASFIIGLFLVNNMAPDKKYKGSLIWPLVLGALVFVIVGSIPIIGWLAKFILMLVVLGAVLQVKREAIKDYR